MNWYTLSLVNIYWWKYYDLLTKSVDSTDSDLILKNVILYPLYFILPPPSSNLNYSFFNSFPFFIHPHLMFSPPMRLEPSTYRFWAWHVNHYTTLLAQKSERNMNFMNGFWNIIAILKNYRIFQYFSLIIFMVLPKLSPCLLEISIIQQVYTWSATFTNSISKFSKYFKVPENYKKFR